MFEWAQSMIMDATTLVQSGVVLLAIITVVMVYGRTKQLTAIGCRRLRRQDPPTGPGAGRSQRPHRRLVGHRERHRRHHRLVVVIALHTPVRSSTPTNCFPTVVDNRIARFNP